MGASQSVHTTITDKLNPLQRNLLRMNNVTYAEVVNFLEILNSIMEDVSANEPTVISFSIINPGVESNVIWKLLLRICCQTSVKVTGECQSKRILKLHHFIRLYDDMTYQVANLDLPTLTSELFSGNSDTSTSFMDSSTYSMPGECPICWERSPDVVLACTHAYCHECITQWNRECPLCRGFSDIDADSWQYVEKSEAPSPSEQARLASERNRVLISLADKAGQPMS